MKEQQGTWQDMLPQLEQQVSVLHEDGPQSCHVDLVKLDHHVVVREKDGLAMVLELGKQVLDSDDLARRVLPAEEKPFGRFYF